jgi:GDPmannose 4,6-dehydratase
VDKKIALITGVTGQDGSYLAELLLSKGYVVHGIKRRSSSFNTSRVDHIFQDAHDSDCKFFLHYGDLVDSISIFRIINEVKPTEIYNLAAQSHVAVSFESPEYTANADALGTLRILEAIRQAGLQSSTKFYQASTSEMFGGLNHGEILNESSEFHPRSPYGVAKLFSYWATRNYREAYEMFASNGILFNHESPRRGETFVTQKIVQAAVKIKNEKQKCLYLGNLDAIRDWGHAKDYVEGMWKIINYEVSDDWVLATGITCSVREFAEKVFRYLGIPITWSGQGSDEIGIDQNGNTIIKIDPRYYRPNEVPYLQGDASKAKKLLGWEPKYSLEMLIEDMIEEELKK